MKTLLLTEKELYKVISILVESKKEEFLKKKYNVSDDVIELVKEIDPTKKYMEWLIKVEAYTDWLGRRGRELVKKHLSNYAKDKIRKSLPQKYQDINGFRTVDIFLNVMKEVNPDDFVSKTEAYEQTYIGRADRFKVYQPTTYAQSCKLGSDTRWCTAADSSEGKRSFKSYSERPHKLYIFIDGDEKYQYSTKHEFKNKENEDVEIPKEIFLWLVDNGHKDITFKDKLLYDMPINEEDLNLDGGLAIRDNTTIKKLPDNLNVGLDDGMLYLENTAIEEIGENTFVSGTMTIKNNEVMKKLPNKLMVRGGIYLKNTNIEEIGEDTYVGTKLDIEANKRIKKLPNIKMDKKRCDIVLTHSVVEELPDNFYVTGFLNLAFTPIKKLPSNLYVGTWLNIPGTNITELPPDLYVGGNFYLSWNHPLAKYTDDELRSMVKHIVGRIIRR